VSKPIEDYKKADYFYFTDSKGKVRTWRRNGRTITWKRDLTRFKIPIKFGLYAFDYITEQNYKNFTLENPKETK